MTKSTAGRRQVLHDPLRNHGTALDYDQRRKLGLTDRLPSAVEILNEPAARCWAQRERQASAKDKFVYLDLPHDRNETL